MNKLEFYAKHGVSKVTGATWIKRGWIVVDQYGRVDVEKSDANISKFRDSKDPRAQNGKAGSKGKGKPAAPVKIEIKEDETVAQAADRVLRDGVDLVTIEEARRVKENYLALLNKLEYEKESGALVELAVAESALFNAARQARDAWMNWPTKFGPLMAADLGVEAEKLTQVLSGFVHKQIEDLGDPTADFGGED